MASAAPRDGRTFECSVCVSRSAASTGRRVACPRCAYEVCRACQKRFLRPACMSCGMEFTRAFLLASLGRTYVDVDLRRHRQRELMDRERALLPFSQREVDRERWVREERALARFGERPPPPPAGAVAPAGAALGAQLPCPVDRCRGYVERGSWVCGVCRGAVCPACRAAVVRGRESAHACDPADVASVELVEGDSRPCPRCAVRIHRASGCDAMHCTHCGANFNWRTGALGGYNAHYWDVTVAANTWSSRANAVAVADGAPAAASRPTAMAVSREAMVDAGAPPALVRSLYDDLEVVDLARRSLFADAAGRHGQALAALRVRFLLGEVDEAGWTRQVYLLDRRQARRQHVGQVLAMYVDTARDFQRVLARTPDGAAGELGAQWRAFADLCNASLETLHREYGGARVVLRRHTDLEDTPALAELGDGHAASSSPPSSSSP